jgi:UDP-N-acetylmuramate--alanine ligase
MTHYHFIGIGGAGLSPIARVLLERGHRVSGSDLVMSPMAQELSAMGVKVSIGHDAAHVTGADVIIRSSAIPDTNVEVAAGTNAHVPVVKRADFLGFLTAEKEVIAVAGTHGKTTTTAMIAACLTDAGLDPSYVIGGTSKNLGTNAHAGQGKYFVIEADEYDRMFLGLNPKLLVVTNVEHDHPDCFPTREGYFQAFVDLGARMESDGILLACGDHPGSLRLMETLKGRILGFCYGTHEDCDYKIENISHKPGCGVNFNFIFGGFSLPVNLSIPGDHNAFNAAAAIAASQRVGIPIEKAIESLSRFAGTGRRFDIQGEAAGVLVIDDYAHHPSEIRATLSAARRRYPDREIWVVWQPHTYSRTRQLFDEFKKSFSDADHVIVTEIYASREKKQEYSSREIASQMNHPDARQIGELNDVSAFLKSHLQSGNVLLVLSAGDADSISRDVLNHFLSLEATQNDR